MNPPPPESQAEQGSRPRAIISAMRIESTPPQYMSRGTEWIDALNGFFKVLALGLFLYPAAFFASLYLTWFAAWAALGSIPRPNLDDPKYISRLVDYPYTVTHVLGTCIPVAFVLGCGLVPTIVATRAKPGANKFLAGLVALFVFALCWGAAFLFLRADPWEVFTWYCD